MCLLTACRSVAQALEHAGNRDATGTEVAEPRLLPVDINSTAGGYFDIYQKSVFKYARNARLPPPHPPFRDGKKHSRLAIYHFLVSEGTQERAKPEPRGQTLGQNAK